MQKNIKNQSMIAVGAWVEVNNKISYTNTLKSS